MKMAWLSGIWTYSPFEPQDGLRRSASCLKFKRSLSPTPFKRWAHSLSIFLPVVTMVIGGMMIFIRSSSDAYFVKSDDKYKPNRGGIYISQGLYSRAQNTVLYNGKAKPRSERTAPMRRSQTSHMEETRLQTVLFAWCQHQPEARVSSVQKSTPTSEPRVGNQSPHTEQSSCKLELAPPPSSSFSKRKKIWMFSNHEPPLPCSSPSTAKKAWQTFPLKLFLCFFDLDDGIQQWAIQNYQ